MTATLAPEVLFERTEKPEELVHARADRVRFVYVPYRRFFSVEGSEPPGSPAFKDAISTLFPVAYSLHFALRERGVNAPIGMLEGVFWSGQPGPMPLERFSDPDATNTMSWRLLIAVPDEATDDEVRDAIEDMAQRPTPPPALDRLRCHGWLEGECAQTLHVGAYDAELPTMERLHDAIGDALMRPRGCHHEIYLSGPQTAPERTKTVIRVPVEELAW